jgi:hypothetical protein
MDPVPGMIRSSQLTDSEARGAGSPYTDSSYCSDGMDGDESDGPGVPSTKQVTITPTPSRSELFGASAGDEYPDPDEVSAKAIDQLVNEELFRLSLEDREQVYHDVHGVSDQVEETPEFLEDKLRQLSHALKQLVQADQDKAATTHGGEGVLSETAPTYAYSLAVRGDPSYVEGRELCLRFLRADQFDVGKAAQRMLAHFTSKLEYFGTGPLARDIIQQDLEPKDLEQLHCGSHQLLPSRDRAGRAVTIWIPRLKIDVPIRNKMRSAFYAYMDMSKSEETQKKGYVDILYLLGAEFDFCGRELAWKLPKLVHEAIPLRLVANHICYDKFFISPLIQLGLLSTGTLARLRLRSHYGKAIAFEDLLARRNCPCSGDRYDTHSPLASSTVQGPILPSSNGSRASES